MILGFLKGFNVNGRRKETDFENKIKKGIKLHTIRVDGKNRWRKGMKIHFATGNRTPQYNCFKEGVCTGTQTIEIRDHYSVLIGGRMQTNDQIQDIAINDGFDTIEDFWAWFDQYTPFTGKIIHWTNIRYDEF
jgi:hypothetical protein